MVVKYRTNQKDHTELRKKIDFEVLGVEEAGKMVYIFVGKLRGTNDFINGTTKYKKK